MCLYTFCLRLLDEDSWAQHENIGMHRSSIHLVLGLEQNSVPPSLSCPFQSILDTSTLLNAFSQPTWSREPVLSVLASGVAVI